MENYNLQDFSSSLKNLQSSFAKCLSIYCPIDQMKQSVQIHDNYATGEMEIHKFISKDDLLEKMEVLMDMEVLCTVENNLCISSMVYTYPYENNMFVFHVFSQSNGFVFSIAYTIFRSMEVMDQFLLDEIERLKAVPEKYIIKKVNYTNFIRRMR